MAEKKEGIYGCVSRTMPAMNSSVRKNHGHLDTHDSQENRLSLGIAVGTEAIASMLAVLNLLQELRAI
ncbi:MAG: hypothetical protein KQI78_09935 [Deltaproteobacteria bacterium]|nr:hypothetical protein [Deltaproteobacteria bacterium]